MSRKWGNEAQRSAVRKLVFIDRYEERPVLDDNGEPLIDELGDPVVDMVLVYRGNVCYICEKVIDLTLPPGLPGSPESDDIIPVSKGGNPLDIDNQRPTHKICNGRKSNRPVDVALRDEIARRETSRVW